LLWRLAVDSPVQEENPGNTHQPGFRQVLAALSRLPTVARIEQAFFE
jgi:hypothetical protein